MNKMRIQKRNRKDKETNKWKPQIALKNSVERFNSILNQSEVRISELEGSYLNYPAREGIRKKSKAFLKLIE